MARPKPHFEALLFLPPRLPFQSSPSKLSIFAKWQLLISLTMRACDTPNSSPISFCVQPSKVSIFARWQFSTLSLMTLRATPNSSPISFCVQPSCDKANKKRSKKTKAQHKVSKPHAGETMVAGQSVPPPKKEARKRQKEGGSKGGNIAGIGRPKIRLRETCPKPTQDDTKRSRGQVGAAVGMSGRTYEKAKEVEGGCVEGLFTM